MKTLASVMMILVLSAMAMADGGSEPRKFKLAETHTIDCHQAQVLLEKLSNSEIKFESKCEMKKIGDGWFTNFVSGALLGPMFQGSSYETLVLKPAIHMVPGSAVETRSTFDLKKLIHFAYQDDFCRDFQAIVEALSTKRVTVTTKCEPISSDDEQYMADVTLRITTRE